MGDFLLPLIFTSPAFVLPLILGPVILGMHKGELGRLAGWLTLKPVLATPLWIMALLGLDELEAGLQIGQVLSLLPAIALTGIIIWRFRGLLRGEGRIISLFIVGDALRWLNTFAWMQSGGHASLNDPFFLAGWILPNAYAIMAFVILRLRSGRRELLAG